MPHTSPSSIRTNAPPGHSFSDNPQPAHNRTLRNPYPPNAALACLETLPRPTSIIGRSPELMRLFAIVERIAPIDSSVLITGETGTGKELVARVIHERSRRRHKPFVDVNCSAIVDTLFEAELFGHQRGTFTGAHETRCGLLEKATGGTLFLDEVDMLDLAAQAKLLRVLQERQVRRVGGRENIAVDVRILAASNCDLRHAIAKGEFRSDLFFRLCVVPLHVPPLRARRDDIQLLAEHFTERLAERTGKRARAFSPGALTAMTEYDWPGNVRELENAVEYALAVSDDVSALDTLPPNITASSQSKSRAAEAHPANASLTQVERQHILSVYERCGSHQIKTAEMLGIDRRTLYRKLKEYGVLPCSQ